MSPDVLIIGGGLMGCAIATELASRGARVRVLERAVVGAEASSAAAGILSPSIESHDDHEMFDLGMKSLTLHEAFADRALELGVDTGFTKRGTLRIAFDEATLERITTIANSLSERGVDCRVLDRAASLELEPAISDKILGSLFVSDEAKLDPAALVHAYAAAAKHEGASFLCGHQVRSIETDSNHDLTVHTDKADLQCELLVIAAGAWTAALEGIPLSSSSVFPIRGQMVAVRSEELRIERVVFGDGGYVLQRNAEILSGSTEEHVGFDRDVTAEGLSAILQHAMRVAPAMARCRFERAWSNFRPGTIDGRPLIGRSRDPHVFIASGHYRHGILLAPITARAIAQLIFDESLEATIDAFDPMRFERGISC
ncbi:MAG: glycine oxidase ThiO [Polyangiales bacterium]